MFDPKYQPWTGGGNHFSFLNQPQAAERNFHSFCMALLPLLKSDQNALVELDEIRNSFAKVMQEQMEKMWATKLGLNTFDAALFKELAMLMLQTSIDYTIFFRQLSTIPEDIDPLKKSFYQNAMYDEGMESRWSEWLKKWKSLINNANPIDINATSSESREKLSKQMKRVNPKYTLREWFLVPAYQQATEGDYALIRKMQEVMTTPYDEQSIEIEEKYYSKKPSELFEIAGISHVSCSS